MKEQKLEQKYVGNVQCGKGRSMNSVSDVGRNVQCGGVGTLSPGELKVRNVPIKSLQLLKN